MKREDLATLYGVGLLPYVPGTWGSLVAALLAVPLLVLPYGWAVLILGIIWALWAGTAASTRHMQLHNTAHDPKEIVVDELAGQWLTYTVWHLWMVALAGIGNAVTMLNEVSGTPVFLGIGFLLFRFFDILKPWPISWADRKIKGGFGVMFDDVLAALAAGTVLYAIYLFWPVISGQVAESAA